LKLKSRCSRYVRFMNTSALTNNIKITIFTKNTQVR
jgi:hypothetical protein